MFLNAKLNKRPYLKLASLMLLASVLLPQAHAATSNKVSGTPEDKIIVLVNDDLILQSELAQAVQQVLAQNNTQASPEQIQNQVANNLILRKIQLSLAKRMGIKATNDAINKNLQKIAKAQGIDNLAEFQRQLDAQQAGQYAKLRNTIAENIAIEGLQQQQIANRVRVTDQDIENFLASPEAKQLNQSEYQTLHIRIPYTKEYALLSDSEKQQARQLAERLIYQLKTNPNQPLERTIEIIQKDYPALIQGGDMGYHKASNLPLEMADIITKMQVGDISAPIITPQGIDVVKLQNKRAQTLTIPQWKTRHILITPKTGESDEMAHEKIKEIYQNLQQGQDFANLAATYSDDPSSAARGGDLDWVSENEMVPEFETIMKQTPIGTLSAPFKTQYGWHILTVDQTRQQDISEQYRKNLARELLYQRMAIQAQEDWLQELKAAAYIKFLN